MMTPVGLTARWMAANRALETESPNPLFDDPFARALAGEEGFALRDESRQFDPQPGKDGPDLYLSVRTRFFDDALLGAVREGGPRQVVLLAAGMDARAFRLAWPDGVALFEVDRAEVLDLKEAVLRPLAARPGCARAVVPADLGRDWAGPLVRAGFDPGRPAAFLAEGLLMYLDARGVVSLLQALRRLAAPGSWLGADLVGTEFLTSPYTRPFLEWLDRLGCPFRFGTSEPEQLLARHGWEAKAVLPGEPEANYGRWPYPVRPRGQPDSFRSYLVTARRT